MISIEINQLDAEKAKEFIKKEKRVVILDVRTIPEHLSKNIPNSKLIPLHELQIRVNELDKGKKILVYCRSGSRSMTAARFLKSQGFSHVYNLSHGIISCPDDCFE